MEMHESVVVLDGPATFLDVVFETIEAHVHRTGSEYEQIITGVDAVEAGDVDHDDEAVLRLFVLGDTDPEEALELVELALDRIADEHNMELARQSVQLSFENEELEEEL